MRFELYQSLFRRQWRWRWKANNNRIVATSGEGYNNRKDCIYAIQLVMRLGFSSPVYQDGELLSIIEDPMVNDVPVSQDPKMQALVHELNIASPTYRDRLNPLTNYGSKTEPGLFDGTPPLDVRGVTKQ
jgi:uncharacterized protein YegP (UPF0339 family)